MKTEQLKAFLTVSRHGSFTRAAEELYLSQPAVSRQVRKLEEDLGVLLIERIGKTLRLTDAGRTLLAEADRVLGRLDRVREVVQAHATPSVGSLRIGASTTPGLYLLPDTIAEYRTRRPEVEVRFEIRNSLEIERAILRNELDLGFVGGHLAGADLDLTPIARDEIVCFAGPGHALSRRRRIRPEAVAEQTWILREKGSATRRLFEARIGAAGGEIRRTIHAPTPEAARALARTGLGVSFMSIHGLRDDLASGRLSAFRIEGVSGRRDVHVVRHREKHLSPALSEFLELAARRLPRVGKETIA